MVKKLLVCILAIVVCSEIFAETKSDEEKFIDARVSNASATPGPTPKPKPNYAELETMLTEKLGGKNGDWSLYFEDYKSGDTISINSHQVYSASLIKLFVAETAYAQAYGGRLAISSYTEDLIRKMLTYSDNDAWAELARKIGNGSYTNGMRIVTTTAQNEGFSDTGQFFKGSHKNYNFTSVNDCGAYLHKILDGTIVSPEYSEKILNYLKQQQETQKLPSGVPDGIETANKTGELEYIQGDAAIVYAPAGTYILVMIGDDLVDSYGQIPFFVETSETIYDYLNK